MDKVTKYKKILQEELEYQASIPYANAELAADGKTVTLYLPEIAPVDVMTIEYHVTDTNGTELEGMVQNTIHELGTRSLGIQVLSD